MCEFSCKIIKLKKETDFMDNSAILVEIMAKQGVPKVANTFSQAQNGMQKFSNILKCLELLYTSKSIFIWTWWSNYEVVWQKPRYQNVRTLNFFSATKSKTHILVPVNWFHYTNTANLLLTIRGKCSYQQYIFTMVTKLSISSIRGKSRSVSETWGT